jgi:hypothetical protein
VAKQLFPSKTRGVIWLICSLVVFGVAAFTGIVHAMMMGAKFVALMGTLFLANDLFKSLNKDLPFLITLFSISLLAYSGIWYGVMLIVASYKRYSFLKTRILTLALSVGSLTAALVILNFNDGAKFSGHARPALSSNYVPN